MVNTKKMGGTQAAYIEKIYEVVCRQLDVEREKVTAASKIVDDLGADDLALIEIILDFEEQFEMDIPDAELFSAGETTQETMQDVINYLLTRVEFTE